MPAAVSTARHAWQLDSPAGQYNFLQGGELDLVPEKSDTYTYGVILQPRFLPKLAMSIDYFDIEIEDTISTVGPDTTLKAATSGRPGVLRPHPAQRRTARCGAATATSMDLNTNIGSLATKGWDLSVTYTGVEMGRFGELNFNLVGTMLDELITDPGPGCRPDRVRWQVLRCHCAASRTRNGGITSASAGRRRGTWTSSLTWRYYDAVENIRPATAAQHRLRAGRAELLRPRGELAA